MPIKAYGYLGHFFFVGIVASLYGYLVLDPEAVSDRSYRNSLFISNVKNMLIVGYFLGGWLLARIISEKRFLLIGICLTTLFSGLGIFARVTGHVEWAIDGSRMLSTVNDPNVAGFICLMGLLFCWRLLDVELSSIYMKMSIVFVGGLCSLVGVFLTGSRTSMLGLGLMFLLFIISNFKRWKVLILILSLSFFFAQWVVHFGQCAF